MIKSPLRYPGGKSRAIKKIMPLIPDFEEFREPFVGGGSVFIALKQRFPNRQFWINDLYQNLYTFWKMSQAHLTEVVQQVKIWKSEFDDGKELFKYLNENNANFNELKMASAFFVYNRITFSGTTEAGGFSKQAFDKRFTGSSIQRLELLQEILIDNIQITNSDYQEVIDEKGKNVFLFLDPPYYSATSSALYGKNGKLHTQFDHERLAKVLENCPHRWLMTYDDSEYIRNLYHFAKIQSWDLTYGMRNITVTSDQLGKELFISNEMFFPKKVQFSLFST